MATLAEQRAQIAEGMRRSRQGMSEASRRAAGQAMIERRTGRAEVDDINALVNQPRQRQQLRSVEPRGSVPPQRGRGNYTAPPASGGGGIASPLTVQTINYAAEPQLVETIDGSGLFRVRTITSMVMLDAEGREIVVQGFGTAVSVEGA
jgi:hypothetical protein